MSFNFHRTCYIGINVYFSMYIYLYIDALIYSLCCKYKNNILHSQNREKTMLKF